MHIFLIGYYGVSNVGDDLCLRQSKALLSKRYPQAHFDYLGSKTCPRFSLFQLFTHIRRSDLVVFGGGGLLQNATSTLSLYYYVFLIILAKLCRKPVHLLSQGIGPVSGSFHRFILRRALSWVQDISVRDAYSGTFVGNTPFRLTADLAFYHEAVQLNKHSSVSTIAVNCCSSRYLDSQLQICEDLRRKSGPLQFLDFFSTQDGPLLQLLAHDDEAVVSIDESTFYSASELKLSLLIAMRYHSCVWAAYRSIPFIALAYDPKVYQLASQLGQPVIQLYDEKDAVSSFKRSWDDMTMHYEQYKDVLQHSVQQLQQKLRSS